MAVRVGPYQRIVGINFPSEPKYITYSINFVKTREYAIENGTSPNVSWDRNYAIGYEYLTRMEFGFIPNTGDVISGFPELDSQSFGVWEYVDQRTFITVNGGADWANNGTVVQPLTGDTILDADPISGTYPKTDTSVTIEIYETPYEGGVSYFTDQASGFPIVLNQLGKQFTGSTSFTTLENAEFVASKTFDFSAVTIPANGKTYATAGIYLSREVEVGEADYSIFTLLLQKIE